MFRHGIRGVPFASFALFAFSFVSALLVVIPAEDLLLPLPLPVLPTTPS
jgi:membrane protein YqaA with SNARE-associated domain